MDCLTDNTVFSEKTDYYDFSQVEPSNGCLNKLKLIQSKLAKGKNTMEVGLLELAKIENVKTIESLEDDLEKAKTIKDKAKINKEIDSINEKNKELEEKSNSLMNDVNIEEMLLINAESDAVLLCGTIKGNLREKGYLKINGEEIEPTIENIAELDQQLYNKMLDNAKKLKTISEAEAKN